MVQKLKTETLESIMKTRTLLTSHINKALVSKRLSLNRTLWMAAQQGKRKSLHSELLSRYKGRKSWIKIRWNQQRPISELVSSNLSVRKRLKQCEILRTSSHSIVRKFNSVKSLTQRKIKCRLLLWSNVSTVVPKNSLIVAIMFSLSAKISRFRPTLMMD